MQLVAYGAQDIYLTGNPQITFFKVVYRRHTNFSMELIQQTINGTIGASNRVTSTISRNGDLVGKMYLKTAAGAAIAASSGDNPGHNAIDSVEVEIGGQRIDKHYGHWMEVHSELTEPNPGNVTIPAVVATMGAPTLTHTKFQALALAGGVTDAAGAVTLTESHFIPLRFWFNRNPGLYLPLIALQYHEVKIILNCSAACDQAAFTGMTLEVEYVYLDTDERRRFAQVSHEYLIEQVQLQEFSQGTSNELNFNHPVKELIWAGKAAQSWGASNAAAGTFISVDAAANNTWKLVLNGHDRMASINTNYYTKAQVYQHHTGYGGLMANNSIAVYSFALKPEEHQPSGTCNFSRIDNARLVSSANSGANGIYVYAVNYNVLRIMSGMGGLAYSN
jgi:hypothetical protein